MRNQRYCTHCGEEIEEIVLDHTRRTRYHPMYGQKQYRRIWMRVCPNRLSLFSEHYGHEVRWEWMDT